MSRRVRRRRTIVVAGVLVVAIAAGGYALTRPSEADADPPAGSATTPAAPHPTESSPSETSTSDPSPSRPAASPAPTEASRRCDAPEVTAAIERGSDAEVIAAFGGGEEFRHAVAAGEAPCIDLHRAGRTWVVVNKRNALEPEDYWPVPQARPAAPRIVSGGGWLRADVAAALDGLAAEAAGDGMGRLGIDSAFRPYDFQVGLYNRYVASRGQQAADLRSARPGHSEHQTGLAVDVVACGANGCGSHDDFRGTPQARWLAENAWRFGFIVRYEQDRTETTGYAWEPWHLRYIGTDLARAYRDGGFSTLEEFFGLPAAPTYVD
ncbi:putative carboxypeptidase YodJ [Microbacterium sp. TNHR37B]|nr:putative carboxypeptidase YodJ [Microbacterium sp. TNHR37B]